MPARVSPTLHNPFAVFFTIYLPLGKKKYPDKNEIGKKSLPSPLKMFRSKKSQKQVEHSLKDIINSRDNSNKCGECGATFPTWASVNLGLFLCGRCASLHRNLGEEISIVKSLTLDQWTDSDLDNMASIGNRKARKFWNPKKEPFPYDDDDKDEIFLFLRNKYVVGKFRYQPPTKEDYNLDSSSGSNRRDRFQSRSPSYESRPGSSRSNSGRIPTLSHRDIPEIERLKYRKLEPILQKKGFSNVDNNYEALSLAKGDIPIAIEILSRSDDSFESKPPLPKRPNGSAPASTTSVPAAATPAAASGDWWSGNTSTQTGLIEPPQQYLDPQTGVIYVDPVQQQLYEQQQAQLLQSQQTNVVIPQIQYTQYQQPQQTGLNKDQLLSLYGQPTGQQQAPQQALQQAQFQQTYQQPVYSQQTGVQGQQTGIPQYQQQQSFYGQQQFYQYQ